MTLYYLMLTQEQADALNDILCPLYTPYPYVPANGGLFAYTDDYGFGLSIYDPRLSQPDKDYILLVMQGKKTYLEAGAAGWIQITDD